MAGWHKYKLEMQRRMYGNEDIGISRCQTAPIGAIRRRRTSRRRIVRSKKQTQSLKKSDSTHILRRSKSKVKGPEEQLVRCILNNAWSKALRIVAPKEEAHEISEVNFS